MNQILIKKYLCMVSWQYFLHCTALGSASVDSRKFLVENIFRKPMHKSMKKVKEMSDLALLREERTFNINKMLIKQNYLNISHKVALRRGDHESTWQKNWSLCVNSFSLQKCFDSGFMVWKEYFSTPVSQLSNANEVWPKVWCIWSKMWWPRNFGLNLISWPQHTDWHYITYTSVSPGSKYLQINGHSVSRLDYMQDQAATTWDGKLKNRRKK